MATAVDNRAAAWAGAEVKSVDFATLPDAEKLAGQYADAQPFPHIVIDNVFDEKILRAVVADIAGSQVEAEKNFYGSFKKHKNSDVTKMMPATRRFIEDLNSAPFLHFLEVLTGIKGLIPDPHLEGGGVHQIGTGGFLKVHTDFNWHRHLGLHRRINLLVYLNENWQDDWNGHLELWDEQMANRGARIAPIFNRMVVFSTTDSSYHGHPDPLTCPEDVRRNSIALYYYSAERPAEEIKFGRSEMTNYRARPTEAFAEGGVMHKLHQAQIKHPLMRKLLKLVGR